MPTAEEVLQIIACDRGDGCVGIRWAVATQYGYPASGFRVLRGDGTVLGEFHLPDMTDVGTFEADFEQRRPACGPYFAKPFEELWKLRSHVLLVDPRTADPATIREAVLEVARFFSESHKADAELRFKYFGHDAPRSAEEMLSDAGLESVVTDYYRKRALDLLLMLSLRFEFAAFFGFATDDPQTRDVRYAVEAEIAGEGMRVEARPTEFDQCRPPPPEWLTATPIAGLIRHPDFESFLGWTPPASLAPTDANGIPLPAKALAPRVPATVTALAWAEPPEEWQGLIGYGPVLYRIWRSDAGAPLVRLSPSADILRPESEPHYVDDHDMPWPPLDGPYDYHVKSVNLIGQESATAGVASVNHADRFAPPAPRATLLGGASQTMPHTAQPVSVDLLIDWDAAQDFVAPDALEFFDALQK